MKKSLCYFKEENGGATVEAAILSLVMVPMAIYAIFFFDLSLMNIKILEASRYAAWEMTAMQISDWKNHKHNDQGYLNGRIELLKKEVQERWGDDMNSATAQTELAKGKDNGIFKLKISSLTVTELNMQEDNMIIGDMSGEESPYKGKKLEKDGDEPEKPSDGGFLQSLLSEVSGFLGDAIEEVYGYFGFYKNGFVLTSASVNLKFDRKVPLFGAESMILANLSVQAQQRILVDAWDLKDGSDVDYGPKDPPKDASGAGYYFQVKKMMFGGLPASIGDIIGGGEIVGLVMDAIKSFIRLPWDPVVRSYALKKAPDSTGTASTNCEKNRHSCFKFGDNRVNSIKNAPDTFYTNVFKDTFVEADSPYNRVYRRNGDGYYMGCDKPEIVDRQDCWR